MSVYRALSLRIRVAVFVNFLCFGVAVSAEVPLGMIVSDPGTLNTNAASDSGSDEIPQVTTDGLGNWVAVWQSNENLDGEGIDDDIFVARSTDKGQSWSAPAVLNAASDSGDDRSPQVATDGAGNWVAVWMSNENLGGTASWDWDIFVARSTDNGQTWTAPAVLNTNAASDSWNDDNPTVTTDGAGNWVAVWQSKENGLGGTDSDIFVARSTDNGQTWTAPAVLNANAAVDTGSDYEPQLATDGSGNWVAVWHSSENLGGTVGTDADIFVARSTDKGQSWSAPAVLNTNAAADTGSDSGPQVTTDSAGSWVAVWQSKENMGGAFIDDDIFVARSTDNGQTWSSPAILNTSAWSDDSGNDQSPQVTTDGAGNWVAVWMFRDDWVVSGRDWDIFVARSTDNGQTWSDPAALNTNAASDSGDDQSPKVATGGAGNWVATWMSTENLGGTNGTDSDIFFATLRFATQYTLTYIAGSNGLISGDSPQTVEQGGSGTPVEAVPDTGYHFMQWSDGLTDNPRTDTNVTTDTTVTATFTVKTPGQYTLTYNAGANGSITSTITAVPKEGYNFVQWSDGSTDNPRTDTTVTGDISVTAIFVPEPLASVKDWNLRN